jgi:1-acyl-sn-glycerol-3-phosphate acyltransferase
VHVTVGEPIDMSKILQTVKGETEVERRKEIADFIQECLYNVKDKKKNIEV